MGKVPEQAIVKATLINEEKLTREGRNRSRNGSHFRRRCRSNDVVLKNGKQCGSMSSLEMEIINDKVITTKPYSDLDINSVAGNRRNYSDVYSEVTFLPGGFRSFPRPPRANPSNLVAQHVAAID